MPKIATPLTEARIKKTKPDPVKTINMFDGGGLYLQIKPSGTRLWRMQYPAPDGRRRTLSFGPYSKISLEEARFRRSEALAILEKGIDPFAIKRTSGNKDVDIRFDTIAMQMLEDRKTIPPTWNEAYIFDSLSLFRRVLFPEIGDMQINKIDRQAVKTILDSLLAQRKFGVIKKIKVLLSYVFQRALNSMEIPGVVDWAKQFPKMYLSPPPVHRAAITKPSELAKLLRAVNAYSDVSLLSSLFLRFSLLTFVRPGEAQKAEWFEFDLQDRLWRIPAQKMKMRRPHIVPLTDHSLAILDKLRSISGGGQYVFPNLYKKDRPISENLARVALRTMGFGKDVVTPHGFRTTASTILNEKGWPSIWIERQLAHQDKNKVRDAYRHAAEFLPGRKKMMDWWGHYLDALETGEPEPELPINFFSHEG